MTIHVKGSVRVVTHKLIELMDGWMFEFLIDAQSQKGI